MKGKYYVELYDGDRRRSLCLRTDSYELACQRYAAGLKELRKKIRAEHEAAKPQERLAWLPEDIEAIRNQYEGTDFDPQEIATLVLGLLGKPGSDYDLETGELKDKRAERLAEQIAGIEVVTWNDLVANAERVRRRKTGDGYSPSWHRNITTTLKYVDFEPEGLTPARIHQWMTERERDGWSGVTLKNQPALSPTRHC